MSPTRRAILAAPALLLPGLALAQAPDPRLAERGVGPADAPVRVQEFFSLTCSHCAAFHREVFPKVKAELVDKGAIRLIWRDFPLDRLALTAAQVARSLPEGQYEAFIGTLLNNQDRWAFSRDPMAGLAQMAGLAGMPRPKFDEVVADDSLARAILEQRSVAEREYEIRATPTFSFRAGDRAPRNQSGSIPFERFQALVEEAKKA
ncbi:DsbA family protein [Siccirubricoccus sp. KC 17139]|uniref:DsbA family protein n=1 Tax=Siccirubricoccus soli TaxID=2899147 RepID=A0ABT1D749_9PROT|nr:thioredoxin domain-containing protein [Siccirubricoccus soli]MCO6417736.1 DsbA family protein [Siccirubricoccus soli]MCP2683871.1 DsbA family protein [Siccirubricoccus soli]